MEKYQAIVLINKLKVKEDKNSEKIITVSSTESIDKLNIFVKKDENNKVVKVRSLRQDKEFKITPIMFELVSKNIREKFRVTLSDDNEKVIELEWIK